MYPPTIQNIETIQGDINKVTKFSLPLCKIIFLYAEEEIWTTPLDRLLWLYEKINKYKISSRGSAQNVRHPAVGGPAQRSMGHLVLSDPLSNSRRLAISLSRIYCHLFDRKPPVRKLPRKHRFSCACGKDGCYEHKLVRISNTSPSDYYGHEEAGCDCGRRDCPYIEDAKPDFYIFPGMTKNFEILQRTQPTILMQYGRDILRGLFPFHGPT